MRILYKSYVSLSSGCDVLLEKEPKIKALIFFFKKRTKKPLP